MPAVQNEDILQDFPYSNEYAEIRRGVIKLEKRNANGSL